MIRANRSRWIAVCAVVAGLTASAAAAGVGCGGSSPAIGPGGDDGGSDGASLGDGAGPDAGGADAGGEAGEGQDGATADGGGNPDAGTGDGGTAAAFTVGGSITGLSGSGLVLQDNGGDNLTVTQTGTFDFTFPTPLPGGSAYDVTVLTQPGSPSQTCTAANNQGTVSSAGVTSVSVTCTTNSYTVGGTVSGLASGSAVTLLDNGGDPTVVGANGSFTFPTSLASGTAYAVTLQAGDGGSPACTLSGATGTVGAGDVTSVVVDCSPTQFTVGGTISGLSGSMTLLDNGGSPLTVSANGTFAFPPVADGSAYDVTVGTPPTGEQCTVGNGTGTVSGANVANVAVSCTATTFTVGGTLSGLGTGNTITLLDNGGDALVQNANGMFTFSAPLATGQSYNVTIGAQPSGQRCTVAGGSGTVGTANVTSISVNCAANMFTIGGTVSGLVGTAVLLDGVNGGSVTLSANGSYAFQPVPNGSTYDATVGTQPSGETCTVANATGTVNGANVVNVSVTCSAKTTHTIGGSLSGLPANGSITLQDNGGNNLTLTANGGFTFTQPAPAGSTYDVTILKAPPGSACTLSNNFGTANADVTDVAVTCVPQMYSIGGTLQGLGTGNAVTLTDTTTNPSGTENLTVSANGAFTFKTTLPHGATYAVTVATQPAGQTCVVNPATGAGTVGFANVTNVSVLCH